jgi:hypothetical protein
MSLSERARERGRGGCAASRAAVAAALAALAAPFGASSTAVADDDPRLIALEEAPSLRPEVREVTLNERLWYRGSARKQTAMSEVIVDQLTELGNQLGYHLDAVSMELIALKFDGRRRRMHFGVGAGERGYLSFRVDSDFHFVDGLARVTTRIDLAIAGKTLELSLPEVELEPTSFRGERGVEVRLPIINKRF